ncbi:TetR/AcrR family transcriptional regulator [Ancylobacter sp. WKF20]|uniref:TetR/AcrR family transcriptional regulator n=1 Tax=Ancylobacter sp. WKF20 TaxID=3039801 RepID=UPI0024343F71|nr:TetR/AcrR family transcriptional regulator [Ancylobacter sp. WKF20]WGD29817.1 TetR/AcrR family transcriptional regulator [Ancylobacter sp. WKF20]
MTLGALPPSSVKLRGRPKVIPDDQQKERIVAQAFDLFCDRGYSGMNMDEVAARCRISKKTLYRLFPSKLELTGAIIDAHRQSMIDTRPEWDALPLVEALERVFRVDISDEENRARIAFVRAIMVDGVAFPELRALVETRGRDSAHAMLVAWLKRQQALGRVANTDAPVAARVLLDTGFSPLAGAAGHDWEWPAFPDWRVYLRRAFTLIAKGLEPRP